MKHYDEIQPQLATLCTVLEKYTRISKMPFDFGIGEELFPQEIHLISAVAHTGRASVSELARRFGTTKGAASQMVGKLVDKGLLTKRRDPDKGSRLIIEPTDKGRAAHEGHMNFHKEHDRPFFDWLAGLCTEEYQFFSALCEKMDIWMDSYLD